MLCVSVRCGHGHLAFIFGCTNQYYTYVYIIYVGMEINFRIESNLPATYASVCFNNFDFYSSRQSFELPDCIASSAPVKVNRKMVYGISEINGEYNLSIQRFFFLSLYWLWLLQKLVPLKVRRCSYHRYCRCYTT